MESNSEIVIRKREEYVANGLGKVTKNTAINPFLATQAKEPVTIWEGFAVLGVPTKEGVAQVPVEFIFSIEYQDVADAFKDFQKTAMEEFKKQMEEAEKRQQEEMLKRQTKIVGPSDLGWK